MVKLLTIIQKDFKILIRSKSSALIILVGPLLLILLVGTAFNTSTFSDIRIGAYSSSYNDLTNSILTKLEQDQFRIVKLESKDQCIDGVKTSTIHICAAFPSNLNVDSPEDIELYVDQSRINLVYAIKGTITSKVAERSKELSSDLTGIVINQLSEAGSELKEKRDTLLTMKSENIDFRDELANVEGSLMSMNLDFTEPNTILEEIQNKTNELKADFNETRKFTQLEDLVISLKALFKDIADQSSTRDNVLTSISSLKEDISANNQRIQDVKDSTDSIITKIEAIEVTDVDSIVSPIKTVTKPISREKTHINYLFPTLIMMIVMFVSLLLSSITVIREKISSAYFRNFISPTNSGIFVLATYLTNILIITVQLIVVFGVMMAINPSLASTLSNVSLAILLITTVFILLGMIVGYVFTSEETATVGAISLGTVLLFFSNTIIPLETLPTTIKNIANFNIFVIGESILRKLILFESSLKAISKEISILLAYMFIFIAIIAIVYRASAQFYNIKRHLRGK